MLSALLLLRRVLRAFMLYVMLTFLKLRVNILLDALLCHFVSHFFIPEECEVFCVVKVGPVFHSWEYFLEAMLICNVCL